MDEETIIWSVEPNKILVPRILINNEPGAKKYKKNMKYLKWVKNAKSFVMISFKNAQSVFSLSFDFLQQHFYCIITVVKCFWLGVENVWLILILIVSNYRKIQWD